MPSKPRTAVKAASKLAIAPAGEAADEIQGWDEYVAEAAPDVVPFRKRLPDGEILEVGCPTGEQLDDLGTAQRDGNVHAMYLAIFGTNLAPTLLDLTAKQPFTVRVKIINDVMMHYGMSLATLPNSGTSSN